MTSPTDTTPTPPHGSAVPPGAAQEIVLTRSEERLRANTETIVVGTARLRKVVVTEEHTITVQLRHEEYVLDHEPLPDGAPLPTSGDPFPPLGTPDSTGTDAVEVVLHAERPVVTTEIVPVERIRLSTRTVTTQVPVTGAVRREVVEYTAPEDTAPGYSAPGDTAPLWPSGPRVAARSGVPGARSLDRRDRPREAHDEPDHP